MTFFVVIIPTFNRAKSLAQAVESVRAQIEPEWTLHVLDDGSTDETPTLMVPYRQDARIHYHRYKDNRGGVAMNEIGMSIAVESGAKAWVRLGSDDWFEPEKLALDRLALGYGDACFGPYENEGYLEGAGNYPRPAREELIAGSFSASWANIAVKTSILRKVHDRFGNFVHPDLRNMEDWLFNLRAARFTDFIWRGQSEDGAQIAIGQRTKEELPFAYKPDAWYRVAQDGATYAPAMRGYLEKDMGLTERLSGIERAMWAPDSIQRSTPVILPGLPRA